MALTETGSPPPHCTSSALRACAVCLVVLLSGCGGGGGGGSAVQAQPEPPPPIPRTLETDYVPSDLVEGVFSQINYDWNEGDAGTGVKVAIIDAGINPDHPTLAEGMVSTPLTVTTPLFPTNINHGTFVAMVAGGRIGKTAYGVAYGSDIEFLCCVVTGEEQDAIDAVDYLGETSDAFAVNNSWGFIERRTYRNEKKDNCRSTLVRGNPIICDVSHFQFLSPSGSLEYLGEARLLKACVDPDNAVVNRQDGTKERLCVFSAGNFGLHMEGEVYGNVLFYEYWFDVIDLIGAESPLSDAERDEFEIRLYERTGLNNLPELNDDFAGHYLIVAALQDGVDLLADYSNGCGEARLHCLSAPGDLPYELCATDPVRVCDGLSEGTSYSAPLVTGAAALLKSTYPHLSAPDVASILLGTAEDIGAEGPDDDFGMGKLDVLASLQPVGVKLTSAGESLAETVINAGTSLGPALARSAASFGMFDSYERPYLHRVADRVYQRGSGGVTTGFLQDSAALVAADARLRMGLAGTGQTRAPAEVSLRRFGDDASLRIDSGFEQCDPGCLSRGDVKASSLVPSSALAWSEHHVSVPFGRMGTAVEVGFADDAKAGFTSGGLFYAGRLGEASLLRIEAGALAERETFMGSGFGGALELGAGRGRYVSAQLGADVGIGALSASYILGKERAGRAVGSLVAEVSDATYDGYRIAYGGKGWEVHHTVPLAATGGGMRIESVGGYTGESGDWSIVDTGGGIAVHGSASQDGWDYRTDSHWVDFGTADRERRTGFVLSRPSGAWDSVFAIEHVSNSPREVRAGSEARVAVGLRIDFD